MEYTTRLASGCSSGLFRETVDGGVTCRAVSADFHSITVAFVDERHGWSVGCRNADTLDDQTCATVQVRATTDGGKTWRTPLDLQFSYDVALAFSDAKHGWLVPSFRRDFRMSWSHLGPLYRTVDGGASW